ncbi:phenazine biosynthesis protein PhzF family [Achlya hypogyna]|uniref:Phenazine biosynthesis protein PhzF family n=1 Tax=Achlya hypogyna TaxID=1202772 RepID=A0A1V9Z1L5_ACHHY|nr:phenazine biosynthesis protein PhzF family [Achlya hypogyna]
MELVLDCVVARQLDVVVVDAFATKAYEGNPAAVVVMSCQQFDAPGVAAWMQQVAMERNLSETAYVAPLSEAHIGGNEYRLRWFTPGVEIDLCGHATLATAHTLYEDGHCNKNEPIRFHTRSGVLTTRFVTLEHGATPAIEMDFPAVPKHRHDQSWLEATTSTLIRALRVSLNDIVAIEHYGPSYICHLRPSAYDAIGQPDFGAIATLACQSVIVTCAAPATSGFDFFSRFFGPNVGVNEDPVTGSAHCALVPYWHNYLEAKTREFRARQTSARGGVLSLRLTPEGRVFLTGSAVVTLRGKMID